MTGLAFRIEALNPDHNRRKFSCGDSQLDDYLHRFARQHAASNVSRTYVASQGEAILGYYSLAMSAIAKAQLPERYLARFPNFPLPVARFEFESLPDSPLTLWLPTTAIAKLAGDRAS